MKSLIAILRAFVPWFLAGLCIYLLMFTLFFAIENSKESLKKVASQPKKQYSGLNISGFVPQNPVSKRIVSELSLSPAKNTKTRLIAAMIENHEDARPHQSGLKDAIAVFELIVEGDISRFIAFFREDKLPDKIGPIRSLRTHFVSIALGYKPLLLHAGGHPLAYEALENHPELKNHDGIRFDGETYERDPSGVAPHNLFMPRESLVELLENTQIQETDLPLFKTNPHARFPMPDSLAHKVHVSFGSQMHNVTYTYNRLFGTYTRSTGEAEKQAIPKNILILETQIDGLSQPGFIPWTQTFGDGKLLLFSKGKVIEGTWQREKGEPFEFLDAEGNPLPISKGQTWVTMLESHNRVEWK